MEVSLITGDCSNVGITYTTMPGIRVHVPVHVHVHVPIYIRVHAHVHVRDRVYVVTVSMSVSVCLWGCLFLCLSPRLCLYLCSCVICRSNNTVCPRPCQCRCPFCVSVFICPSPRSMEARTSSTDIDMQHGHRYAE
jgi:hypothetical protein